MPGPAASSPLDPFDGIATDGSGDLFVSTSPYLVEITPNGTLSIIAGDGGNGPPTPGPSLASQVSIGGEIAADDHGHVYGPDPYDNDVLAVTVPGSG